MPLFKSPDYSPQAGHSLARGGRREPLCSTFRGEFPPQLIFPASQPSPAQLSSFLFKCAPGQTTRQPDRQETGRQADNRRTHHCQRRPGTFSFLAANRRPISTWYLSSPFYYSYLQRASCPGLCAVFCVSFYFPFVTNIAILYSYPSIPSPASLLVWLRLRPAASHRILKRPSAAHIQSCPLCHL